MKEKITFADLVDKIAEETGSSKQLVHDLLHETVNLTREGLGRDGHVNITGLGRFSLKWHKARTGRNPQTGDAIEIPARSSVNYKPSADLRKYINRNYAHLQAEILDEDKKPVIENHIAAPVIEEKIVPPPVTESPKTPSDKKKKRSLWWLWMLITLLIIILAYMAWNFWLKTATDKEPIATEMVTDDAVVQPIATEEPVEEVQPSEAEQPIIEEPVEEAQPTEAEQPLVAEPVKEVQPAEAEQPIIEEPAAEEPIALQTTAGTPGGQHITKRGDNLWIISQRYYNKADLWPNIYRVNHIEIKNPDNLAVGNIIQVPALEGKVGSLTHNDSANIAEGNIRAYLVYKKLNKTDANDYLWVAGRYDVDNKISQFSDEIDEEDINRIKGMKLKE
ncbi:MAG: HU family DNA-binding protein [Bacteroidetes bacterium]|nr:HU family DNA-binding protein [Bacteroidota bacterium]MBL6943678.1 HU family DNA-binding protein [Bacteroidales bacterium]